MLAYILRRLAIAVPTLIGISILTFAFTAYAPGDPLTRLVANVEGGRSGPMTPEALAELRREHGLDRPLPVRYLKWVREVATGNLGERYTDRRDVSTVIFRERLRPTLELMGVALLISLCIGVPLGVLCAIKQYGFLDYSLTVGSFVGISLPEFFASILLIYVLAVRLHLVPTSGRITPGSQYSLTDNLHHIILPAIVLSLGQISILMRFTRSSVLEVVRNDFVNTARAKGLSESRVLTRHVLRNALLPLITIVGTMIPRLIGGSAVVETVFQWPGLGSLYLDSVYNRDFITIMAMMLLTAVAVLLSNLAADVAYAIADPRIRLS
ncbi:MAG: ABC transporter permease [Thermomicrobiales bacterium]|nr:ABC transporter permease [Thermomicrobiales bacterium]